MTSHRISILGGVAALLLASNASACIETSQDYFKKWTIKNGCSKPVHVAWCFGKGCEPDGDTAKLLGPGFSLDVGGEKQKIQLKYCVAPKKFSSDNRCR